MKLDLASGALTTVANLSYDSFSSFRLDSVSRVPHVVGVREGLDPA
jgi:hypothetical protein